MVSLPLEKIESIKMKTLIFEKIQATRQSLENQIQSIGENIEVMAADDIDGALNILNEYYFDLIVIDMDNLNGQFHTLKKLAFDKNPDVTLIMLTLYPYANVNEKFLKEGVDYCFDKIVEFESFLSTVSKLIKAGEPELDNLDVAVNIS